MTGAISFVDHLRRQLRFLEHSCASYDAGFEDEAIRIATIIRVLVHDTDRSTSLLNYLNATTLRLLSTTIDPDPNPIYYVGLGMTTIGVKSKYVPHLGGGPFNHFMPVSAWWAQVVMVLNRKPISRRTIVLAAANQDGGAHVDATLRPEYEALARDGAVGSFIYETHGLRSAAPIEGAHLVSLRQLGYEVLNSPELTRLV